MSYDTYFSSRKNLCEFQAYHGCFRLTTFHLGSSAFYILLQMGSMLIQMNNPRRLLICSLPGLSDRCKVVKSPNFQHVFDVQSNLEPMVNQVGGVDDIIRFKQSTLRVNDLITMVGVSKLTNKDLIAKNLEDFLERANSVTDAMHELGAGLRGAVDR